MLRIKTKNNILRGILKSIGIIIGLVGGILGSYFSFVIVLNSAEKGNFNYLILAVPFLFFIIIFLLGLFLQKIINKSLKKK